MSIIPYKFENIELRVEIIENEPWFIAKDVCDVLDLQNVSKAINNLDEDEKGITISDTLGGNQKMTIINESGLYSLILRSNKPQAKVFKKWITNEVLPSIRKTGSYQTPRLLTPTELMEAHYSITKENVSRIENIEHDLGSLKNDSAFTSRDCFHYKNAVHQRVNELKDQHGFTDEDKPKLYSRIHSKIKSDYQVPSYKDLPPHYSFADVISKVQSCSIL